MLPSVGSAALRDSPHLHGELLQKDRSHGNSGIKTQQSSQQPLLSLSQIDNQNHLVAQESSLELKDAVHGLAGSSLNNMCDLTFSTHCSSNVASKGEPIASDLPSKVRIEGFCDQNREHQDALKSNQISNFDDGRPAEQNGLDEVIVLND